FKALVWSRRGVNTRINHRLDLSTAIVAGPAVTNFVFAHICRPLRCNQRVIAFGARHSIRRAIVDPRGRHDHLPYRLISYGVTGSKHYETSIVNLWMNGALPQNQFLNLSQSRLSPVGGTNLVKSHSPTKWQVFRNGA